VSNAALRYKPTGPDATEPQPPAAAAQAGGGMRGGGLLDDLTGVAGGLKLEPAQQASFDTAINAMRQRQTARQAQRQQGGASLFGGGPGGGPRVVAGGRGGDMQAQIRQRTNERFQQDFAAFRAALNDSQKQQWDAALAGLLNAKRAPVYKLVAGEPQLVQLRIGASDGTNTEVSGDIKQGDLVVVGERAKE